jgi:hypothetical protein
MWSQNGFGPDGVLLADYYAQRQKWRVPGCGRKIGLPAEQDGVAHGKFPCALRLHCALEPLACSGTLASAANISGE